jgi:hypothetical protein
MNDFWEWRSSLREFEGKRHNSRRGRNIFIFAGALLFIAFIAGLVTLKYLGI